MPWKFKPKKDVADCDKPREGVKHPLIRGFPNGEIQHLLMLPITEYIGNEEGTV